MAYALRHGTAHRTDSAYALSTAAAVSAQAAAHRALPAQRATDGAQKSAKRAACASEEARRAASMAQAVVAQAQAKQTEYNPLQGKEDMKSVAFASSALEAALVRTKVRMIPK